MLPVKILLTGESGQLARELLLELAGDAELIALGRSGMDLAQPSRIRQTVRRLRPDLIINSAAYTAVDQAEHEQAKAFAINGTAPGVLAEEADRLGAPLLHFSTDYVFDGKKAEPYTELDAPQPLSVYGASKLAGEQAIQAIGGQHLILRTSWVYSRHGRNFLLTMQRLLQERRTLEVVNDERGAPTWAGHLAQATAALVRRWLNDGRFPTGLYHLTASGETSWHGFAQAIATHLHAEGRLRATLSPIASHDYPTPANRPANSRLSCVRLERDWGVRLPNWEAGLSECLANASAIDAGALAISRSA